MIIISSGVGKKYIKEVMCSIENVEYVKQEGINQYFETPNDEDYMPLVKIALNKDIRTRALFYSFVMNEISK